MFIPIVSECTFNFFCNSMTVIVSLVMPSISWDVLLPCHQPEHEGLWKIKSMPILTEAMFSGRTEALERMLRHSAKPKKMTCSPKYETDIVIRIVIL